MEELLVLLRRPVGGEQVLQGGGIEVFVLHAILLFRASLSERIIAHRGDNRYSCG
jgi:hypothetical protein